MRNKKKYTLSELDAYAHSISKRQSEMLYENRLGRKYASNKVINEAFEPDSAIYFKVFVPGDAVRTTGETIVSFVFKIVTDDNIKYKVVKNDGKDGVWFYSDIPSFYEKIIIKLCKMGLGREIRPFTEPDYQQLIDKVEPEENGEEK